MTEPRPGTTQERIRRLNLMSLLPSYAAVGVLLVAVDAQSWWEVVVLGLGVAGGLVAVARWAAGGMLGVALPCVLVTAAVWVLGVLVIGGSTAFYGLTIAGSLTIPELRRYRNVAAVGLTVFVAGVGAARLLMSDEGVTGVLIAYVFVPAGAAVVTTGALFVTKRFNGIVEELEQSREREAELAVMRERMRFASDLHDIQGHTLHVVKLKVTLAEKLLHTDLDQVRQELREVRALVGDTITETKELAYAQRRLNLSTELENAKNLFEAAGIQVHVEREAEVDIHASELLGQVLRETTTNILRHAQTEQVRITLSASGISILNDGVSGDGVPELRGLSTLRQRLADNGGKLTVDQKDGHFLTAAAFPPAGTRRSDR